MARLIDRSITLDLSGFREANEAIKKAMEQMDRDIIKQASIDKWERILKEAPNSNWATRSLPSAWQGERTMTSREWYINHQAEKHNTYSILSDNYRIEIAYNKEYDNLTIQIVFLTTGDTIEYHNISKEHLFRLFDINNLLYQIDNVYKCVHCENTIIDNDEIKEHKELCIANILEDLEDNWNYIKWMR